MKLLPGSYTASITIPTGKAVFADGFGATVTALGAGPTITVADNARLRLVGASVTNPTTSGISISCGDTAGTHVLELDQVTVTSGEIAISTSGCTMTITRSRIRSSLDFILCLFGGPTTVDRTVFEGLGPVIGEATITDSVFTNQSSSGAFSGGTPLGGASAMNVSFSSVINTNIKCGTGTPVCKNGTAAGACINNSIIVNTTGGAPADTVTGSACFANYSAVFPQSTAIAGANNLIGINALLKDIANGDYHLQAASPAVDAADPAAVPTPDFDGTSRPQGTRSDMGAFEFKP